MALFHLARQMGVLRTEVEIIDLGIITYGIHSSRWMELYSLIDIHKTVVQPAVKQLKLVSFTHYNNSHLPDDTFKTPSHLALIRFHLPGLGSKGLTLWEDLLYSCVLVVHAGCDDIVTPPVGRIGIREGKGEENNDGGDCKARVESG
jgi:hypothetical protein